MFVWVLYTLILLHGPNGQVIAINPDEIVSIREPRAHEGHFPQGTHCIVNTADGKFTAVVEECKQVREVAKEHKGD